VPIISSYLGASASPLQRCIMWFGSGSAKKRNQWWHSAQIKTTHGRERRASVDAALRSPPRSLSRRGKSPIRIGVGLSLKFRISRIGLGEVSKEHAAATMNEKKKRVPPSHTCVMKGRVKEEQLTAPQTYPVRRARQNLCSGTLAAGLYF
jgi:hypothetical protein